MKIEDMGKLSRYLAERGLDGFQLGCLLRDKLLNKSRTEVCKLPDGFWERITPKEVIDSFTNLKDAQSALSVLETAMTNLMENVKILRADVLRADDSGIRDFPGM